MERNDDMAIHDVMQTMISRWVEKDELQELEKVQSLWGNAGFQPQIVETGRLFHSKRRVCKIEKPQRNRTLKGDLEEYTLFIFNDILIWAQFSKTDHHYKFT